MKAGVRYLRGAAAIVGGPRVPWRTDSIMLHVGLGLQF
jgi:hypothetical protein